MAKSTTNSFTNLEIARLLRQISAAYTILGENRFKIIAYDNAATAVEHATSEIKDLWQEKALDSVPGLGPAITGHLDELFRTGRSRHFDAVLKKVNPAVFPLLEIPGIGPKKAQKLVENLHIKSAQQAVNKLKTAAKSKQIAGLTDFGEKSEQEILSSIERHEKGSVKEKRMVLPLADAIADDLISYLREEAAGEIVKIDKLGSLRRQVATIGDIDLAVSTNKPSTVVDAFVAFPKKTKLIEKGPTGASILLASGRQADLRVSAPDEYGAMLQYFTGSKYHNIRLRDLAIKKGFSLNEYGMKHPKTGRFTKFHSEEDLYHFLKMDYIPPEIREDAGEIDAALKHDLPDLVTLPAIRGDLQVHSDFDPETSHDSGANSLSEIKTAGEKLGYDYVGVTDHNPSSKHSANQITAKLQQQSKAIEKINSSAGRTRLLSLLEVDIAPDGHLPVPDEGLASLDGCLVSVHSNFTLNKIDMTKRVLRALSHPVARILAHPTGRLLGERDGFELDWEAIFDFCREHNKALEINAYPNRLDLPDTLVRRVVQKGVRLSLGTDSHEVSQMQNMKYGVSVARRGWATNENIINTWNYSRILSWFRQRN